jgi:hypothetical protein
MIPSMRISNLRDVPDPPWIRKMSWLFLAAVVASFFFYVGETGWIVLLGLPWVYLGVVLLLRARKLRRMRGSARSLHRLD